MRVVRSVRWSSVAATLLLAGCGWFTPPPPTSSMTPTRVLTTIFLEPLPAEPFENALGGTYTFPKSDECKAVVLVFFGHDCPMSNAYAPEIKRLADVYQAFGVAFCVVYADADLSPADARQHAAEYAFPCPAILDPGMTLAKRVGATKKPEAAVLSPDGELVYLGRIDDINVTFGKKRAQPTRRELKDALDAVLAGQPVAVSRAPAIGCDIDFPK